ncbi:MAG TPA: gas vesicle protein GvpO [Armatimonadota bacterium]|nr:gas vesicle protein GvpO [Armatimonadota bacterium]
MSGQQTTHAAAEATRTVTVFFEEVLGKRARVIALESDPPGWRILVEAVEDSDYLRRLARSDMMGVYEVRVGPELEVVSYTRKGLRDRTALEMTETSVG